LVLLASLFFIPAQGIMGQILQFAAACLIVISATLPEKSENIPVPKWLEAIGDSSYSLYLCHPFLLGACKLVTLKFELNLYLFLVISLFSSIIIAYISYLLLEKTSIRFLKSRFAFRMEKNSQEKH